jgi:hypothetical protein
MVEENPPPSPLALSSWAGSFIQAMALAVDTHSSLMKSVAGFPQGPGDSANSTQTQNIPVDMRAASQASARAAVSTFSSFAEFLQQASAASLSAQQAAAREWGDRLAESFRAVVGTDPAVFLAASERDWSPNKVVLQSLSLADNRGVSIMADLARFLMTAQEASTKAASVMAVMNGAWLKAARTYADQAAPSAAAETKPAALQHAWAAVAEPILQDALRSDSFANAHASFLTASSRHAKARSALARRFADFIEVPSREEMNETYEAIQDLRREVRALKRLHKDLGNRGAETTPRGSNRLRARR